MAKRESSWRANRRYMVKIREEAVQIGLKKNKYIFNGLDKITQASHTYKYKKGKTYLLLKWMKKRTKFCIFGSLNLKLFHDIFLQIEGALNEPHSCLH